MDFTVEKQIIQTKDEIKNEIREYPLDCEVVIPDYCPDIARVLKCRAIPSVAGVRFTNDMAIVEGTVLIMLLYADEEGELSSFSQTVPIYHEMNSIDEADSAQVTAKMQYCNCRAVNARKLEFHGAASFKVVFTKVQSHTLITGAEGSGIQLLTEDTNLVTLSAQSEKRMVLSDEILIESGSVRCILQQHAVVQNISNQIVSGKCVVKGELFITASYQNTKRKYELVRSVVPFSQIIEADGLEEEDVCSVNISVLSLDLRPRTGLDGECKNLSVGAELKIVLNGYRAMQLPLVIDGYSTDCGVGLRRCSDGLVCSV
ncbi:MAG: DUF3794 domain-containing protein, partial [Clostridia bacterium]|nr:DUF3794 domain-containing protein [Clostridia bacterium]